MILANKLFDKVKLPLALILVLLAFYACKEKEVNNEKIVKVEENPNLEAREDSLEMVEALNAQSKIQYSVVPKLETKSVSAKTDDDAADDPAIWYNTSDPQKSVIYGTNKKGGLIAYDLSGEELEYYKLGKINNADVIQHVKFDKNEYDFLVCTNRTDQSIELFKIEEGRLVKALKEKHLVDTTQLNDVYGVCFAESTELKKTYVFVNAKNGCLKQFEIIKDDLFFKLVEVSKRQFESQTEGLVADKKSGLLYVGVEDGGIYKIHINPLLKSTATLISESTESNHNIRFDLEGLTILDNEEHRLLIASSQGNFSYAVFDINDQDKYLGSFTILENGEIDGVEETDGLDISTKNFGPEFPNGILVVQDGFNNTGKNVVAQNFKFIDLAEIYNLSFLNK